MVVDMIPQWINCMFGKHGTFRRVYKYRKYEYTICLTCGDYISEPKLEESE